MLPIARHVDPRLAAYESLLAHPRVLRFMRWRVRDLPEEDAEDVFSQALEALWQRRVVAHPPDDLPRMRGLARRVVDGKIADYYRRKAVHETRVERTPHIPRDADDPLPESNLLQDQPNYVEEIAPPRSITALDRLLWKEQLAFVRESANEVGLTGDDLEVMQGLDADELTVEQAAAARGMPEGTLGSRLHRIRQKLHRGWAKRVAFGPSDLMALIRQALARYSLACQKSEEPYTFIARKRGRLRLLDQGDQDGAPVSKPRRRSPRVYPQENRNARSDRSTRNPRSTRSDSDHKPSVPAEPAHHEHGERK
jgi:RNA polymerase sigma factor (sigma-70 family)